MTQEEAVGAAAVRLGELLASENEALVALAFARSADLAEEKEAAIAGFNRAVSEAGAPALPAALARELTDLVAENKRLLERALFVQGQVIACIARAAPRRRDVARSYGCTGALTNERRASPMTLTARA